jgi:hypothetical protein
MHPVVCGCSSDLAQRNLFALSRGERIRVGELLKVFGQRTVINACATSQFIVL